MRSLDRRPHAGRRRWGPLAALAVTALASASAAPTAAGAQDAATPVKVFAAGSLRAALTEAATQFEAAQAGRKLAFTFGASGLLKDRLAAGEPAEVFASANMAHPQALKAAAVAGEVQRFTRNQMCLLVRPGLTVDDANVVDRMLDPALKLGTSTPQADPSGDYAWLVFDRVEAAGRAGAAATLKARALQLTGGPTSPPPPVGRNVYGVLVAEGQADLFLTYCTNATLARREHPQLQSVNLPERINVGADYGVTLLRGATPVAQAYVDFLLSPAGQAVFARHGFAAR